MTIELPSAAELVNARGFKHDIAIYHVALGVYLSHWGLSVKSYKLIKAMAIITIAYALYLGADPTIGLFIIAAVVLGIEFVEELIVENGVAIDFTHKRDD